MTRRQILLALVVVLQTAALIAMVGMKQHTLATGIPVLLETQPVDPRSLFRGDYVILRYTISTLRGRDFPDVNMDDFERHDPVYIVLREGDEYWEPVSIHKEHPALTGDDVVIKGKVEYGGSSIWDPVGRESVPGIRVRYGIEAYFVPEGEGREIELPRNEGKVSILVAVDAKGNAGIKGVLVDGELRYEESLF